eukprot:g25139.t1
MFLIAPAQVLQTVQVPRRFPGHFMPHRLCNHWNLQGWCKKAETCTFAHGVEELHPDVQAQLLQQKPGMPPPTVTKDGRLVVHGVTKPAGKVEVPGYPMQPLPNLYEQSTLLGSGLLNTNFAFNLAGPQTVLPLTATTAMASKVAAQEIGEEVPRGRRESRAPADQDGARDRSSSPGTPSKRRPAPAPLTFDDSDETPGTAVPANLTRMSPTVRYTTTTIRAPLASPMRVSLVSRSLPSPVSTGFTPTGMGTSVATSVAMAALSTPKTTVPAAVPSLESPARVTFNRAPGGFWPTSPVSVLPTTPVPIDRSTLLQARQVAVRMEQGPPGLAMWAPTPTTKANLLGFRYPEPGRGRPGWKSTSAGPGMAKGVYDDDTAERLTLTAIEVGYRNFFASVLAGNQKGFARAIEKSGVPRDEFFICGSVLSNLAQDFEDAYLSTKEGCTKNLEAFAAGGITELDMILLDYPAKDCETIRGQWKAFEDTLVLGILGDVGGGANQEPGSEQLFARTTGLHFGQSGCYSPSLESVALLPEEL